MYHGLNHREYVLKQIILLILLFLSGFFCSFLYAQSHEHNTSPVLDKKQALELSRSVIGKALSDHHFLNQDEMPVSLSGLRGKPLVVNFIYTSCYHTCPVMTAHLKNVVKIARDALGRDSFNVISVGFDTGIDTPERMRLFAVERGINLNEWQFLSGDSETIKAISSDLGFSFAPSPKGFDHLAQTTVVDAKGTVYRQVYGADFDPPLLVEPLKELLFGKPAASGKIDQWVKGIKLFCTIYDPTTGRYQFDYSIFVMIIVGVICLGSIAAFVVKSWRQKT